MERRVTWVHVAWHGFTWVHMPSYVLTWFYWVHICKRGFKWIRMCSLGLTWVHMRSPVFTRFNMEPCVTLVQVNCMFSNGFTWTHIGCMGSMCWQWFIFVHIGSYWIPWVHMASHGFTLVHMSSHETIWVWMFFYGDIGDMHSHCWNGSQGSLGSHRFTWIHMGLHGFTYDDMSSQGFI